MLDEVYRHLTVKRETHKHVFNHLDAQIPNLVRLELESVVQRHGQALLHGLQGAPKGRRRSLEHAVEQASRLAGELAVGDDAVHQAELQGALGVYRISGEDQLQRLAWKVLIPLTLANIAITGAFKVAF